MEYSMVGKRIKEYRLKNNMTQLMLAEKTGLCEDAIYKYENGKLPPGSEAIVLISNALNVSPDNLLCDYINNISSKSDNKIIEKLSCLPPDEQNRLIRLMDALIKNAG